MKAVDTSNSILVETIVNGERKSIGAAYVLWLFLGGIGVHRMYLGSHGLLFFIVAVLGWALAIPTAGLSLLPVAIWAIVDLFMIPSIVRSKSNELRKKLLDSDGSKT